MRQKEDSSYYLKVNLFCFWMSFSRLFASFSISYFFFLLNANNLECANGLLLVISLWFNKFYIFLGICYYATSIANVYLHKVDINRNCFLPNTDSRFTWYFLKFILCMSRMENINCLACGSTLGFLYH